MRYAFKVFLLMVAGCTLFGLAGCSRQSTTDFTPYPGDAGTVRLTLAATPLTFTTADGITVTITAVQAHVAAVAAATADSATRAALRAHTHEGEEGASAGSGGTARDDPNREPADALPLVPATLALGRTLDLTGESEMGALVLRAGNPGGWNLTLEAGSDAGVAVPPLELRGRVASTGFDVPLHLALDETATLAVTGVPDVVAGGLATARLTLDLAQLLAGLDLAGLAASGEVAIDADHHDALHQVEENLATVARLASRR